MTAFTHAAAFVLAPSLLVAGAAATAHAAATAADSARVCPETALGYEARAVAPIASSVVLVTVTNKTATACTIDRFPTVTFAGLDGTAEPVPPGESGPRRIGPRAHLYAALRTDDASGSARYVPSLTVSADPAYTGSEFTAARIGAPTPGIAVSSPVATWWQQTQDDALAALPPRAS